MRAGPGAGGVRNLQAALDKAPDDCHLHYNFGRLAVKRLASSGSEHLRIVLERSGPGCVLFLQRAGDAAKNCGRIDEALDDYRKAIESDPSWRRPTNAREHLRTVEGGSRRPSPSFRRP